MSSGRSSTLFRISAGTLTVLIIGALVAIFAFPEGSEDPGVVDRILPIGPPGPGQSSASDIRIEMVAPDDPTKLQAVLTAKEATPGPNGRTSVTQPEAVFFLDNGQVMVASSDRGDFVTPAGQDQPEGGQFAGNGLVRLYAQPASGDEIDLGEDEPVMVGSFERLEFDMKIGWISTGDSPIEASGSSMTVRGRGVAAFLNQTDRSLDNFEIARNPAVRFIPSDVQRETQPRRAASPPSSAGSPRQPDPTSTTSPPQSPPKNAPASEPTIRHYKATFEDDVVLKQGDRRIEADQLTIFFRLIDNTLPPGAIARPAATNRELGDIGRPSTVVALALTGALGGRSPQQLPATIPNESEDPIELTSKGRLHVDLLEEIPEQLTGGNHVYAKFESEQSGVVVIRDAASRAELRCVSLDYAATTQRMRIQGRGTQGVTGSLPGVESIAIGWLDVDLRDGTFAIPGAGEALTDYGGVLTWMNRVDGEFAIDEDGGIWPTEATLRGRPTVRGHDGVARGDEMLARFGRSGEDIVLVSTLFRGNCVTANPDRGDSVKADESEIRFDHVRGEDNALRPTPTRFVARGNVVAEQELAHTDLRCERLEAQLRENDDGQIDVVRALLDGEVYFIRTQSGEPRTVVAADSIDADPLAKTAVLIGTEQAPADIEYGGTTITGNEIRLDEAARYASVFGAGRLTHTDGAREPQREDPSLDVTWSKQMIFSDLEGDIQVHGGVEARFNHNAFEHDDIQAYRLHITLAPGESESGVIGVGSAERRVLRVEAFSESLEFEGGRPALVRSRRYSVDGSGKRVLTRAMNLESGRIIGDNEDGTLDAPGPGRLLVLDHRRDEHSGQGSAREGSAGQNVAEDARGAALFDWTTGMSLDRANGKMVMEGDVRVTHRRLEDGSILNLECHRLEARVALDEDAAPPGDQNLAGDLESVTAIEAVYARWGGRELIADRLHYDAHTGVLTAEARDLTLFDSSSSTVTKGESLRWDLESNRVTWSGASPVTAPISSETRRRLENDR